MKKLILSLFFLEIVFSPFLLSADFLMINKTGERVYICNSTGGGGRIRVKALGEGKFKIIGRIFSGIISSESFLSAARYGCGEK